ncbi:hypothetical protein B5F55_00450 [Anaerotruncus colihominis]|uniref:hypothetical protein n=1 Tax=Anaerotruncus colihominis TaxID=169435 RepID=UPI000B37281B|nr:hypothetical protein [Anaerotruncus colihominis]OUO68727.1 hypothetical protein B5F55_00450 [Anaerotruncus colihominis]
MELYKEILVNVLQRQQVRVLFPRLKISAREIVGMECYKALRKIRAILADDRLNDAECFQKIEEIVQVFDQLHAGCGSRHDFG